MPQRIEFFQLSGRKRNGVQIGKNCLEESIENWEAINAKRQMIEDNGIMFSGMPGKKIESG